jgi:large subunit ribosomal protein L9
VRIRVRAGAQGRLFGSVSASDIADAVRAAGGPELDRRRIEIANPIRTVGRHQVTVRLHPEVTATLDVDVAGS